MKFIDPQLDLWNELGGEAGRAACINPVPYCLLSLAQWHAFGALWPAGMPVGVRLANDVDVKEIAVDLARLSMVALDFPKWVDGRAYSQARTLRARHRFDGEVRATGEVLVDMLLPLKRTGFDAAVLRTDQSLDAAHRALTFFPGHYQGDATEPMPLFARPPGTAAAWARAHLGQFLDAGAAT